jgi:hypothetical protein
MFVLLETYVEREGHCTVPQSHKEDGDSLGRWVQKLRASKKKDLLSADCKRRLESIGITWEPLEAQWEDMFVLLETYVEREGHGAVPFNHKEDGASLGTWVTTQRNAKKKGGMNADRKRRPESLGIVLDPLEAQ